jgi:cation diffusion facilitator family transporter
MTEGSTRVVLAALAGNLTIAVSKFAAFFFTRSSAMLTEAIHSLVDTGDQVLLLIGQKRASLPPNARHPLGYGMETYFWSFTVALMIFMAGGIVSLYEGVEKLRHPEPISRPWISFLVLGVSMAAEAGSFSAAYREYRRVVRGRDIRLFGYLKASKDPNIFAVLLEDGAAMIGLVFAAVGIGASVYLKLAWADGAASCMIGLLLVAVAVFLANETRSLIAGEAAAPDIVARVRRCVEADPRVERVDELLSLHLGPRHILFAISLCFRDDVSGEAVQEAASELTRKVQSVDERIGFVFLRPSAGIAADVSPGPGTASPAAG